MSISLFALASTLWVFSFGSVPPCTDTYVIEIPQNMTFDQSGSFTVRISSNNLNDNQTLHVEFPDEFSLSDTHGKQDISVNLQNNELTYIRNGSSDKQVSYSLSELPVGEWSGQMNMSIYLEDSTPSNVLLEGSRLNSVLNGIDPLTVSFINSFTYSDNDIDVSAKQDRSLLLHNENRNVTIYPKDSTSIIANRNMSGALRNLDKLESISGINLLNMDDCEDLSELFKGDVKLTSIGGIDSFDTGNVTNMSGMFEMCTSINRLALSNLDTSSCTDMSHMFSHCLNLTTPGSLRNWDLSQCENTSYMFYNCSKLKTLGTMATWDTSNISDMSSMFENCPLLVTTGDISGWDVSNVESFKAMFRLSSSMRNIGNIGLWDISSKCHDLSEMFSQTERIISADLDLTNWNVSNVSDTSFMFYNCLSVVNLNITGWDTDNLYSMASMFECNDPNNDSSLQSIRGLEDIDTSGLINMNRAFCGAKYLNADLSGWSNNLNSLSDVSYGFYGALNFDINKLKDWQLPSLENKTEAFGNGAGTAISSPIPDWYYD